MSIQVVYWNNIPAPYMVDRFNAVVRRGNLDLEAWFSARTEPGRSWRIDEQTWEFPYEYLPGSRWRLRPMAGYPPAVTRPARCGSSTQPVV